jgi:hypothetical protein
MTAPRAKSTVLRNPDLPPAPRIDGFFFLHKDELPEMRRMISTAPGGTQIFSPPNRRLNCAQSAWDLPRASQENPDSHDTAMMRNKMTKITPRNDTNQKYHIAPLGVGSFGMMRLLVNFF